jgi:predicted nucleic acid-binding protein
LIDSHVLLDLYDRRHSLVSWSAEAVDREADSFRLVINPIIYAEVSIRYSQIEDLEAALPQALFDREAIPYEAFLAGKSFAGYRLLTRDAVRYRSYFPRLPLIAPN